MCSDLCAITPFRDRSSLFMTLQLRPMVQIKLQCAVTTKRNTIHGAKKCVMGMELALLNPDANFE